MPCRITTKPVKVGTCVAIDVYADPFKEPPGPSIDSLRRSVLLELMLQLGLFRCHVASPGAETILPIKEVWLLNLC